MLIASKYEEIYAPEVRDFVYITDKAYSKEEILKMEYTILTTLDFKVCVPSSYRFLERYTKIAKVRTDQFSLAQYLIELPLIEYRMLKYSPSNTAASALFLALKILPRDGATVEDNKLPAWDNVLSKFTGY
jgi:cyclin B